MSEYVEKILCPRCNSSLIEYNKKGFGLGKAVVGGVIAGGVGLLAGFLGSSKIKANCLSCGKIFDPKDGYVKERIYDETTPTKVQNSEAENKRHNSIVNLSNEEIEKKFKVWDNLCQKGLITEAELKRKKEEYLNKRK